MALPDGPVITTVIFREGMISMRQLAIVFFAVVLLFQVGAGAQPRSQSKPGTASTTDALVFGDRTWVYYLMPNTTTPRKIAKGNFPALSPSGQYVAYITPIDATKAEPETVKVLVFDLGSGKTSQIFQANAWAAHLRWSPRADYLLLTLAYLNGKRELDIVSADGSGRKKLIGGGEQGANDVFSPSWAPDGKSIYFQDMENFFQINLDGKVIAKTPLGVIADEKESITSADSFIPSPIDTSVIAYTRSVPGTKLFERTFGEPNTALFIYNLKTKMRKRVTALDMLALDPVWSADGESIYFSGYHDREGKGAYPFRIYRINLDGTGLIQIASGENPGV